MEQTAGEREEPRSDRPAGQLAMWEAAQRLASLEAIDSVLIEAFDPQTMLTGLTNHLLPRLGDWAVVELLDEKEHLEFTVLARSPHDRVRLAGELERLQPLADSHLRLPSAYPPLEESDAAEESDLARFVHELGVRSALRVPLVAHDHWLGRLTLVRDASESPHDTSDLDFLAQIARRLAPALANARRRDDAEVRRRQTEEFTAVASHELRTPLSVMRLVLESLQLATRHTPHVPTELADRLNRGFEKALRQCQRIVELSDRLLDAARMESGQFTLDRQQPIDLAEVVRVAAGELSPALAHARCELRLQLPSKLIGQWDRIRLHQVVVNLLSNAAKYAPGKAIDVALQAAPRGATLTVRDYGPGLLHAQLERIFQRFERVTTSDPITGWGLGLYISRQIVEAHGGTIRARNELDGGLTFIVDLPRAPGGSPGSEPAAT